MKILAIETSCDETAIAVLECSRPSTSSGPPKFKILAEVVSSQIEVHRPYGGVVPNLAKREHLRNLPMVYQKIISNIKHPISDIDIIAVTVGPGLEPCLWAGIEFAKNLAVELDKPLIGVNHLEGHIYSNWLPQYMEGNLPYIEFPAVVLLVSGGHTILLLMKSITEWQILGETRDDAVGEAFDKVAKMLKLPYPGGPEVERLAQKIRNPKSEIRNLEFPRPMIHEKNYEFSFSGLKTAVLYYLKNNPQFAIGDLQSAICNSFQQAAIDVLVTKTTRAAEEFGAKSVLLCGGVAANKALRNELKNQSKKLGIDFFVPEQKYNTDNAVMIAVAAYINHLQNKKYPIEANGNLGL